MALKKKLQILKQKFRDLQRKRRLSYFGTSEVLTLQGNPLPVLLLLVGCFAIIYFLARLAPYLSQFLYWFVQTLEITKILKIPFLDNFLYYEYAGLFAWVYLSLSLLWDTASLWKQWSTRVYLVGEELWFLEALFLGKRLRKFPLGSLDLLYVHGGVLDLLGANRIQIASPSKLSSSFFFPWGTNKRILDKVLKRRIL